MSSNLITSFALSPPGASHWLRPVPPPTLCHGRLGFLGMGFAACHKSHCQGFPTDPEPCLWGHRHCHQGCCSGMGWQRGPPPPASGLGSRA